MTSSLRPDERASLAQIEKSKKLDSTLKTGAKTAIGLTTAATGLGISSRILPFLSEYIPADLAMKGISKISPKLGQFLQKGQSMGLDIKEGFDFIKNNLEKSNQTQESSQKPPEQQNIISQYSPELLAFLEDHINKGRQPLEAGALAQLDPTFKKIISKMEADHKAPFSSILQTIFGSPQQVAPQTAQSQMQQPQQQGQQGNGDQALLAALDKILKM